MSKKVFCPLCEMHATSLDVLMHHVFFTHMEYCGVRWAKRCWCGLMVDSKEGFIAHIENIRNDNREPTPVALRRHIHEYLLGIDRPVKAAYITYDEVRAAPDGKMIEIKKIV